MKLLLYILIIAVLVFAMLPIDGGDLKGRAQITLLNYV